MGILSSIQGRVIIDLNDVELSVALFDVHTIHSFANGVACLASQLNNTRRDLIGRYTFHIAVDDMAVYRSLDLESLRGDDVATGIE